MLHSSSPCPLYDEPFRSGRHRGLPLPAASFVGADPRVCPVWADEQCSSWRFTATSVEPYRWGKSPCHLFQLVANRSTIKRTKDISNFIFENQRKSITLSGRGKPRLYRRYFIQGAIAAMKTESASPDHIRDQCKPDHRTARENNLW